MGAMIEQTASRTVASLAVGDDMFWLNTDWLIVRWLGFELEKKISLVITAEHSETCRSSIIRC